MKKIIILLIIIVIAGVMVATCPSRQQHLDAIEAVTGEWMGDKVEQSSTGSALLDGVLKVVAGTATGIAIDQYLTVDNYFVCSVGHLDVGSEPHTVSVGVLGHVFTFGKDDIETALAHYLRQSIPGIGDDSDLDD